MNALGHRRTLRSLQDQSLSARMRGTSRGLGYIVKLSQAEWAPQTCQWIDGEPRRRAFCEAAVQEGSSYCEAHHRRCYRRVLTDGEE